MDRYLKIEKNAPLGNGTYGVVYKAKDKVTDKIVALKVSTFELSRCYFNKIITFSLLSLILLYV